MDIWSKIFWQVGLVLSLVFLVVALLALSKAEDGMLTVDSLQGLSETFTALYHTISLVIYPWLALGAFLLVRFLMRLRQG